MIGQQVSISANCPKCGKPMVTTWSDRSLFIFAHCAEMGCEGQGVHLVIERSSGLVVFEPAQYRMNGEPLYPVLADRDGKQVWPKEGK